MADLGKFYNQWKDNLFQYCAIGPLLAFFLWLALTTATGLRSEFTTFTSQVGYDEAKIASINATSNAAGSLDNVFRFAFAIIIMVAGLKFSGEVAGAAGGQAAALGDYLADKGRGVKESLIDRPASATLAAGAAVGRGIAGAATLPARAVGQRLAGFAEGRLERFQQGQYTRFLTQKGQDEALKIEKAKGVGVGSGRKAEALHEMEHQAEEYGKQLAQSGHYETAEQIQELLATTSDWRAAMWAGDKLASMGKIRSQDAEQLDLKLSSRGPKAQQALENRKRITSKANEMAATGKYNTIADWQAALAGAKTWDEAHAAASMIGLDKLTKAEKDKLATKGFEMPQVSKVAQLKAAMTPRMFSMNDAEETHYFEGLEKKHKEKSGRKVAGLSRSLDDVDAGTIEGVFAEVKNNIAKAKVQDLENAISSDYTMNALYSDPVTIAAEIAGFEANITKMGEYTNDKTRESKANLLKYAGGLKKRQSLLAAGKKSDADAVAKDLEAMLTKGKISGFKMLKKGDKDAHGNLITADETNAEFFDRIKNDLEKFNKNNIAALTEAESRGVDVGGVLRALDATYRGRSRVGAGGGGGAYIDALGTNYDKLKERLGKEGFDAIEKEFEQFDSAHEITTSGKGGGTGIKFLNNLANRVTMQGYHAKAGGAEVDNSLMQNALARIESLRAKVKANPKLSGAELDMVKNETKSLVDQLKSGVFAVHTPGAKQVNEIKRLVQDFGQGMVAQAAAQQQQEQKSSIAAATTRVQQEISRVSTELSGLKQSSGNEQQMERAISQAQTELQKISRRITDAQSGKGITLSTADVDALEADRQAITDRIQGWQEIATKSRNTRQEKIASLSKELAGLQDEARKLNASATPTPQNQQRNAGRKNRKNP